jgi:hypothetical protein
MATTLALLIGAHVLALAGVLAMACRDHQLVDEHGRPLERAWEERLVPACDEASSFVGPNPPRGLSWGQEGGSHGPA